jgi:hypothetical protein
MGTAAALLALAWLGQAGDVLPRYGDRGTSELAVAVGYGSDGLIVGAGFRRFVLDGVAPGAEVTGQFGGDLGTTLILGTARLVPLRTGSFALTLTGKGGRVVFLSHQDGWAVGGGAAVILAVGPNAGIELGYEALRLLPGSVCADLTSCVLQGPVIGVRLIF